MKKDSAAWRGLITAAQAIVAFFVGLIVVIWQVPGVPEVVITYTKEHLVQLLGLFGLSTGTTSFLFNLIFRKEVPTV